MIKCGAFLIRQRIINYKRWELRCIATWGRPTSRKSFRAVWAKFVLRMRRNCRFRAGRNYDIAIRLSDPDFLKESNNLAILQRFRCFFSVCRSKICDMSICVLFDLMTLNMCCAPHWDNFHQVWTRSVYPFLTYNVSTADTLRDAVALTWPWPWILVVYRLSCDQTLYQIWTKSYNLQSTAEL